MKRVLSLFLSVLMLTSVVAAVDLSAYADSVSGDFMYTTDSGNATITGYVGSSTSLTIPSKIGSYKVKQIGDYAFERNTKLVNVVIPDTVTKIGDFAFAMCSNLVNVSMSAKLKTIGYGSFQNCTSLKNIDLPDTLTTIGILAFSDCHTLPSITIPDSVTKINEGAFINCYNLMNVNIPDGITKIYDMTFSDCYSLSSISIPKSVTSIGEYAFFDTPLTKITIPQNVTKIGSSAFFHCTSLKSVSLPFELTSIGEYAFSMCENLTSIKIPYGVTSIGKYAFRYCSELKTVKIYGKNASIGSDAFKSIADNATISGYSGSTAQSYAETNSISFSVINHPSHTYEEKITKATQDSSGTVYKVCSVCSKYTSTNLPKIKSMSLNKTSFTYDGKTKKPTVTVKDSKGNKISSKYYTVSYVNQSTGKTVSSMKKPGKYYVKVKFKTRYSGSMKKAVTIKPKATSIKSLSASSKGFTVRWNKKTDNVTGYQVQYSTSSKFSSAKTKTISKNSTTSQKISGLKAKKKYYVRVRTYKTVKINGKSTKIYSTWSSAKGITTKK